MGVMKELLLYRRTRKVVDLKNAVSNPENRVKLRLLILVKSKVGVRYKKTIGAVEP